GVGRGGGEAGRLGGGGGNPREGGGGGGRAPPVRAEEAAGGAGGEGEGDAHPPQGQDDHPVHPRRGAAPGRLLRVPPPAALAVPRRRPRPAGAVALHRDARRDPPGGEDAGLRAEEKSLTQRRKGAKKGGREHRQEEVSLLPSSSCSFFSLPLRLCAFA